MLVAPYPRSANSLTAVFNIRSRVISDGRFIFVPNPDFKRLFEIHHFYVEDKANTEKTFRRPHATPCDRARKGAKEDPRRDRASARGWGNGGSLKKKPLRAFGPIPRGMLVG